MSPVVIAASGALLLGASALLLIGDRSAHRRLQARVKGVRNATEAVNSAAGIVIEGPAERTRWQVMAAMLGYRDELPAEYRGSLRVIGPVAAILGGVAFKLVQFAAPTSLALGAGILVGLATVKFLFHRKAKAYRNTLYLQIPDTMSLMLRAVRAGLPVAEAIRSVGRESMSPTREEFQRVAGEGALGMAIEVTLARLFQRTQLQEYAFFSVVIGLHGQTGGNLSETMENLADMVRRRVAMAGKAKALSAEGRMSSLVVAGLPFVVGALISVVNPGYMDEFVTNPRGPMLVVVFAVLLTTGLFVNNWLIARSTSD